MDQVELDKNIKEIAEPWRTKEGNLIMILHQIQDRYGYVPRQASLALSMLLEVPLARIYEVITFYHYFKLEKPGKHMVSVCMGTACYLKGAPALLDELKNLLDVEEGHTTHDGNFHLDVVRCLGCCGLAPVLKIGGRIYGEVKKSDIINIISSYTKENPQAQKTEG